MEGPGSIQIIMDPAHKIWNLQKGALVAKHKVGIFFASLVSDYAASFLAFHNCRPELWRRSHPRSREWGPEAGPPPQVSLCDHRRSSTVLQTKHKDKRNINSRPQSQVWGLAAGPPPQETLHDHISASQQFSVLNTKIRTTSTVLHKAKYELRTGSWTTSPWICLRP